jgi:porphobilinogen synthase
MMNENDNFHRGRRLRRTGAMREMVRETALRPSSFMLPLFVRHGRKVREPVEPMPGVYQISVDGLKAETKEIASLGIPAVLLFGIPEMKDERGTGAYAPDGVVQQAIRAIKDAQPDLLIATDVCMCEYTDHGHCGILLPSGEVDNDATLPLLAEAAVSHLEAGADIVAPSAMMDGQIRAISNAMDRPGYTDRTLMAYAAKYASAFYGPFRVAAESSPREGDRRAYQMDPANSREAMREIRADVDEGADIVMVKPALAYLDVIRMASRFAGVPVAAYNVSGEYAMLKAATQNGWIDGDRTMLEVLTSISRAGADIIITYHAKEAARLLSG